MKTASAKAKGRKLSTEIKELLLGYHPDLKWDDIQVTSSGCTGEDLVLSPAARERLPIAVECKNQENINIWAALKQAEGHVPEDCTEFRVPVVFFRRNKSKAYVAMSADHFVKLIS